MVRPPVTDKRFCLNCNSDTTYFHKSSGLQWYRYKDGYICHRCYDKLIHHPKYNPIYNAKWNPVYSKRQLVWTPTGKRLLLKENPRKGICYWCKRKVGDEYINLKGKVARIKNTNIHHIRYHEDDPLKDTIELCPSCHMKESWRLGDIRP